MYICVCVCVCVCVEFMTVMIDLNFELTTDLMKHLSFLVVIEHFC